LLESGRWVFGTQGYDDAGYDDCCCWIELAGTSNSRAGVMVTVHLRQLPQVASQMPQLQESLQILVARKNKNAIEMPSKSHGNPSLMHR